MYENQNVFVIIPEIKQIKIVWKSKMSPIDRGCFIVINKILVIMELRIKVYCIMYKK